jgi:protein-S-isoprenylcysteine O-methyltransferase Ste14
MTPESVDRLAWIVWAVSWFAAAAWSDRTVKRAGAERESVYRLLLTAGAVLLFGPYPRRLLTELVVWHVSQIVAWAMVAITVVGFLFTWWARLYLGSLWSGHITRKEHHRIVDGGPYGVVRHPIYAGLILAVVGTTVIRATLFGLVGALLMIAGFYVKARLEEDFLREQLGARDYDAYRRRVPMLVPFPRS